MEAQEIKMNGIYYSTGSSNISAFYPLHGRKWVSKTLGEMYPITTGTEIPTKEVISWVRYGALGGLNPNIKVTFPNLPESGKPLQISILIGGAIPQLDIQFFLTLEEQDLPPESKYEIMLKERDEKIAQLERLLKRGMAYYHVSPTFNQTVTNVWTAVPELSNMAFESFQGHAVKITMDFSAYGKAYGGIRLVKDKTDIYGKHPDYGLDWVLPQDNVWLKRSLVRIIEVPKGKHSFTVEVKSQGAGQFQLHPGDNNQQYSGFLIIFEEL